MIWIIDNGHGGIKDGEYLTKSPHKRSPAYPDGFILYEGQWNREVTKMIFEKAKILDIDAINLVPEIDDISLDERIRRVNKIKNENIGKDLFLLSIHMNGTDEYFTTEKSGLTTFYYRYNDARKYAYVFQDYVGDIIGNRGIFEKAFKMLDQVNVPALLLECGFMNNKKDVEYLRTEHGKDLLTDAIIYSMREVNKII